MNYVYTDCSLTDKEIINMTCDQFQDSVSFFSGAITNTDEGCSLLKEVLTSDAAGTVCTKIRAEWNSVSNIFFCQRKENNNLIVCISSNSPAISLCAVNSGVALLIDLILPLQEDKTVITELHNSGEVELRQIQEHLIQINASTEEINKRIDAFIQRKQEEVNASNIRDFCVGGVQPKNCARVDAVLVTRKDSKSHVRVRRVVNPYGPQPYSDIEGLSQNSATALVNSTVKIKTEDDISQQDFISECETGNVVKSEETSPKKKRSYTVADLKSRLEILQQKLKVKR